MIPMLESGRFEGRSSGGSVRPERSIGWFALCIFLLAPSSSFGKPPRQNGGYDDIRPKHYPGQAYWSPPQIRQTSATTSWFLYPGACVQRSLGTWAAKTTPVADSLQPHGSFPNSSGYTDGQPVPFSNSIAYTRADQSLPELLWHIVESSVPAPQRPAVISGSRSLWCGKFDAAWPLKLGYPNVTYQILYLDTGTHAGSYTLTFEGNLSTELHYDTFSIIGGGGQGQSDHADPLQNRRDYMDDILTTGVGGPHGDSDLLVIFTGSIQAAQSVSATGQTVEGAGAGQPNTVSFSVSGIPSDHRSLYFVLRSNPDFSAQDGLWPEGHGAILDLVSVSDNGSLYNDQAPAGGSDPHNGIVLKGTYGSPGYIASRVPAGVGELWQLAPGSENVTSDLCSPQKAFGSDLFFEGGDPSTNLTINKQHNSIVSCTFPIPAGTASVFAQWSQYMDLPSLSGFYQLAEYRVHKDGVWSDWRNTSPSNDVNLGSDQAWIVQGDELTEATQADSVQLRWTLECDSESAADKVNCSGNQINALLYDDLRLQITTGVPAPVFGIFVGSVAQTTFVDGTIDGTNCTANPCWPGVRGSDLGTIASHNIAIHDNFNSPIGDSILVACVTGLRRNGMGINWRRGFDKSIAEGELGTPGNEYAHTNGAYNPTFDVPRMIFRLFDPSTKTWSPFDSTELVADAVAIADADGAGGAPPETTVIHSDYRVNWPPFDKSIANALLPGGFTVNGISSYNSLRWLPRGARIQYYFKAVDINGGVSYQFSSDNLAREVAELPTLPGSSIKAPDIIEFQVLPGAYPSGPAGSLLAGRTTTPVLDLDGAYTRWSFGYDPMTQALRGLGVRADRYRFLQGYGSGSNLGGHEIPGKRVSSLRNFFPNLFEYPLVDSLAAWYRIMIQSTHTRNVVVIDEQDAVVMEQWWRRETGANGGDRCMFLSGDDAFGILLNTVGIDASNQVSLAQAVFGVQSAITSWAPGNPYPTIDDRFVGGTSAGLAAPGTFTYPIDGGCPSMNRFDALTKVGDSDAAVSATYPNAAVAAVARSRELDSVADNDRQNALAYGFSMQFIRNPSYGTANANYGRSGVENRMRVLYRFLTSCRGVRQADDLACWPCPIPGTTVPMMQSEWSSQSAGFATSTHGPLYPIQAAGLVTSIEDPTALTPKFMNTLGQNRPNPFNPETSIPYSLATPGRVVIRIYDIAGRLVRKLTDKPETAGWHSARWDGRTDDGNATASGVYFYRIEYPEGGVSSKKMILLR
jgi:FlgD Ig-like domain